MVLNLQGLLVLCSYYFVGQEVESQVTIFFINLQTLLLNVI